MSKRWCHLCRVAAYEFIPVMTLKSKSTQAVEEVVAASPVVGEKLTTWL